MSKIERKNIGYAAALLFAGFAVGFVLANVPDAVRAKCARAHEINGGWGELAAEICIPAWTMNRGTR
jgi:hypothetical protein